MTAADAKSEGQRHYDEYWARQMAGPEFRRIYQEEAAKKALWLQLVEARQTAGLTQVEVARRLGVSQAQVARLEKRGYEDYSLNSLRRYVQALGEGFALEVRIHCPEKAVPARRAQAVESLLLQAAPPNPALPPGYVGVQCTPRDGTCAYLEEPRRAGAR